MLAVGLTFVGKNITTRFGEIDLIMKEEQCIVFVEVRYRKNSIFGCSESTVTAQKQERIKKTAFEWMAKQNMPIEMTEFRFDVVAFTAQKVNWLKNAF